MIELPEDVLFTAEHEWVRIDSSTVARIGVTAYATGELGDIVYVSLPTVGSSVVAGDSCGELESTKSVSEVYAPLGGEVVARNEALDATPELVNTDPYGEGWLFEIRPDGAGAAELLDAEAYQAGLET